MRKMRITALLAALTLLVFGCKTEVRESSPVPEQLKMVPSDAIVIVNRTTCEGCLSVLDSADIFRKLNTGILSNAKATLAYCYTNALTPILAIETSKAVLDTTGSITRILEQAKDLGLKAKLFGPVSGYTKSGNIVITTKETMLSVISRHIDGRSSILDAPDFDKAFALAEGAKNWTIIRNSGAAKLLPKNFMNGLFPLREVTSLARNFAEWTCIASTSESNHEARVLRDESGASFIDHINAQEALPSKIQTILPDSTDFVLDIPMDIASYRKTYEKYLDAQLKLEKYNTRIATLKTSSGKNPLKWEQEANVREVALVKWLGHSVVAIRPEKAPEAQGPALNPLAGFTAALYGSAFSLADDSFAVQMQGWYIFGSEADVSAFLDAARPETYEWPSRRLKFIIDTPDRQIYCSTGDIKLEQKKKNGNI